MSASGTKADSLSGLAARPLLGVKQTFPETAVGSTWVVKQSSPTDIAGLLARQAALQSSNRNDLTRQGRAGILAVPDAFDATHRSCT